MRRFCVVCGVLVLSTLGLGCFAEMQRWEEERARERWRREEETGSYNRGFLGFTANVDSAVPLSSDYETGSCINALFTFERKGFGAGIGLGSVKIDNTVDDLSLLGGGTAWAVWYTRHVRPLDQQTIDNYHNGWKWRLEVRGIAAGLEPEDESFTLDSQFIGAVVGLDYALGISGGNPHVREHMKTGIEAGLLFAGGGEDASAGVSYDLPALFIAGVSIEWGLGW